MRKVKDEDMLEEYDFTGGVRGEYYERFRQGTNVVLIGPDLLCHFPDSKAVNKALRSLLPKKSAGKKPVPKSGAAGAAKGSPATRKAPVAIAAKSKPAIKAPAKTASKRAAGAKAKARTAAKGKPGR